MMPRGAVILAGFLICEPLAAAEHLSAQKLYERCSDHSGSAEDATCTAWIMGFADGLAMGQAGKAWCFPEGGTVGQARLVIEKFLRDHPEVLHLPAVAVAGGALMAAFPCPTSN